ncbi:winged helix-turn-helix transcriptional regulator [Candidatus Woesearchaeota archaeon]|nr:winged helix-turn-helix transcriptional regulator [Candidatus Woesearchaeota archaeon]
MNCPSYTRFFETFSNKTRMKIIAELISGAKSVNYICKRINEEQSKVSHNLKKLSECNFINVKAEGKKRIYSLNKDTIKPILKLVEKHVKTYCNEECHKK